MKSAWIRRLAIFGAATVLFAAACSVEEDPIPMGQSLGVRPLGSGSGVGGMGIPGSSSSSSSGSSGGNKVSTSSSSSSSSSSSAGGAGGVSVVSSSSSVGAGGVGGAPASSSSSSGGVGGAGGAPGSSSSSSAVSSSTAAASSSTGSSIIIHLVDGMTCMLGSDCLSGSCADGVCCSSDCTGACMACTAAKKFSGADGQCGPIAATKDPDNECATTGAVCDSTGACDGAGACTAKKSPGFPCAPGSCSGSLALDPSTCNGAGNCVPGGSTPCPAGCLGTICMTSCSDDTACAPNGYCVVPTCVPKKPIGAKCAVASQCSNGFCADGVCCDAACNGGACQACSVAKGASSDGACTPLNGPAPAGQCGDNLACTDDVCSGGVCANFAKVCLAAGDACHLAPTCDTGTGKCGAESVKVCPTDGLGVCETRLCDVTAQGACVVRSRLDGAPCKIPEGAGICVAGSCFTLTGTQGSGGSGGAMATSSAATGVSGATGAGGQGGAGGGLFHFAGGACSVVDDVNDVNTGESRLAWILVGLLFAARRRPRRATDRSSRGSRDA